MFFLTQTTNTSLNESEIQEYEGKIRERECLEVIKSIPNGKSPGTDGLPVEFYKVFRLDIKDILLSCYSYAFETGQMSISQRRGIISLIPKKNSLPFFLKNWRPLSLLNTDYKIATKCIACRLKKTIPSIINKDQTGYLKGRYIGENIRVIYDIIAYIDENEVPGLLFFADFEKAFDKIDWGFIEKSLKYFNFGTDLVRWVKLF